MSTLNTWKKICKAKGISDTIPFDVSALDKSTQRYLIAAYKLPIIIEVKNEGWKPDYTDNLQYKYFIWSYVNADKKHKSGFGLSYSVYDVWGAGAIVGVRFAFKSSALAEQTFNEFKKLFEDFILKK